MFSASFDLPLTGTLEVGVLDAHFQGDGDEADGDDTGVASSRSGSCAVTGDSFGGERHDCAGRGCRLGISGHFGGTKEKEIRRNIFQHIFVSQNIR